MGGFLRFALLPTAALLSVTAAAVAIPQPGARAASGPLAVQLNYACALKGTGQLRFAGNPADCDDRGKKPTETLVAITAGPHYACVHRGGAAFLVASPDGCPVPENQAVLTLPPPGAPAYFCAGQDTGLLSAVPDPRLCRAETQFPVTVPAVHRPPVLSGIEPDSVSYMAFASAVPVTSALTVSDADDATLAGATVSVTAGFGSATDDLLFTVQHGITDSYSSSTGVLTLTGHAPLADYQAALRSVAFATSDSSPRPAARTLSFTVTDSLGGVSNAAARTIDVTRPPAPIAHNDTATTDKNTPVDISVLGNDVNAARLPLTVASLDTAGTKGTVTVNSDRTVHYDPAGQFASLAAGQTATDAFNYTATDGVQHSGPATVTITITGTGDAS